MNTQRLNITIPKELGLKLKTIPNKSAYIAEALKEKLEKEERQKQLRLLAQAYAECAKEDKSLVQEWDVTAANGLEDD